MEDGARLHRRCLLIKGVISDADRYSISLFTLSSFLKATPALSTVVRFHWKLL
ncbi:hypothetical protein QJS04_geneDACA008230 [Acorus gramineus]|uniref:Uncharacterized protein n=1 Tax=Acorus gramineus TaxID=55184 RepID=A0AAV9AYS9_ACOGR|nr:hypothetical protein QJS04_geneDACA008230 [Acorus gramineus]